MPLTPTRPSPSQREPASDEELDALLDELEIDPGGETSYELVSEWAAKHVWRIEVDGEPWAYLRYLLGSAQVYPDRWRHMRLSELLHEEHIGPRVLGLTPESAALQGRAAILEAALKPLSQDELEARAEEAVGLFSKLHRSGPMLEALSSDITEADRAGISPQRELYAETRERWFTAVVERWLEHGLVEINPLTEIVGIILDYLETLDIQPLGIVVPCHNDPNSGNFMLNRAGAMRMIDFEGLALNTPVADLGIFLTWYADKDLHRDLLESYQLADPDRLLENIRVWVPLRYLNISAHWAARLTRARDRIDWEFAAGSVHEWMNSACELVYEDGVPDDVERILKEIRDSLLAQGPEPEPEED